ncbi:MopE-related protein [Polyangium spumosum]|uniref:Uncharacterized protein n=1 Tax=Polyangium spumosum TaxID=889282 RepID=A0A6N7PYR9_9BACT|nr:MopE-related protein [Polyangium spumosum]MRG97228.1 hypothetical protein [Polyangium spumosum]
MASTFRPRRFAGSALLAAALGLASFLGIEPAHAQTFPADAAWKPLVRGGVPVMDPAGDAASERDVVSDPALGAAAYFAGDANFLYVRLRINDVVLEAPPANFKASGWVCLIDTDGDLSSHELIMGVDGSTDLVELRSSAQLLKSYPTTTHARSVVAPSMVSGDADVFLDWAVARVDLGIANQTPFRLACGSSSDAQSLSVDQISEKGALTLAGLAADSIALYGATCLYDCLDAGQPCDVGVGACLATGSIQCDGLTRSCDAFPNEPGVERCNAIDDDCDGAVDEGFDLGAPCDVGIGACLVSGVLVCSADEAASVCDAFPGEPSAFESCNAVDDDCDGEVDEGLGLGEPCAVGVGACLAAGVMVCDGPRGTTCDATPGVPSIEACNGVDDDCDGEVDEGLGLGDPCTVGVGACLAAGVIVCDASSAATCGATPGMPSTEMCNGIDDDCDDVIDEGCAEPCLADAQCGHPVSGIVCEAGACVPGCRGESGNGCPYGELCTSTDASIGECVAAPYECAKDADCGAADSGRVCDIPARLCQAGCRGAGGNGCPAGSFCTSETSTIGACEPVPTVGFEGNGVFCEASGAGRGRTGGGVPIVLVVGLSAFVARRLSREERSPRGTIEG